MLSNNKFTFKCGCEYDTSNVDGWLSIDFIPSFNNIPLNCKATWDLIGSGNTKGIFQLESRLGSMMAKRLKPEDMEQLAGLVSILRPACLEGKIGDKSITDHYILRKNNEEPVEIYHPSIERILAPTYGLLIYQEQAMQIAGVVAGFSPTQSNRLRKACAKKLVDLMADVKTEFLEGIKQEKIVSVEQGDEIFGWIEKSQRYSFNKSHAVGYAATAYLSAYCKAHFPRAFFASYLYYAQEKQKPYDEIKELVSNARLMDIDVYGPTLLHSKKRFSIQDKSIYFGINDIKRVGDTMCKKIVNELESVCSALNKEVAQLTWLDLLLFFLPNINKTAVENMISVGVFDYLGLARTRMLYEYSMYMELSHKEQTWIQKWSTSDPSFPTTLVGVLETICGMEAGRDKPCANKKRREKVCKMVDTLYNPPYIIDRDSIEWIASVEEQLLGVALSCTKVEACDANNANCTIKNFLDGYNNKVLMLACNINEVKQIKTKKGQNPGQSMAFMTVDDITGVLNSVVVFPESWATYQNVCVEENTVMLIGKRGDKSRGQDDSFIVEKVFQI